MMAMMIMIMKIYKLAMLFPGPTGFLDPEAMVISSRMVSMNSDW